MQDSLQLGFIGGGLSSTIGQAHFSASQLDGRWRLASGFFSRNSETNRRTAQSWHVPQDRLYDSWQSLSAAEADRVDAVVVLTPTPEHSRIVCTLLEKNIPVICEKPLVASLEEANTIQESFKESRNTATIRT